MYVCPECAESYPAGGHCATDGAPLADTLTEPLLGQTIGSYRVASLLGVGGMGRVYKAVHPQIGSRVAIKVLSMECAHHPGLVQRFFAEARSVNVIRHESIVNVLDLSMLPDGRPYIVMEYLDGQPLSRVIVERSPLPVGGAVMLMCEVLDALAAAHSSGVVHRDLKPDNIFVTAQGRPKVLDFGIAKLRPELGAGSDATRTGSILGTPHYMSPEQAQGSAVDQRSDLYSLGVILFELLTGSRPFDAPTLYGLLDQHVKQPPPPPSSRRQGLLPAFDQVVYRALAKQPEQRFQSAAEMKQALELTSRALPPGSWGSLGGGHSVRPSAGVHTPHTLGAPSMPGASAPAAGSLHGSYGAPSGAPSTMGGQVMSGPSYGGFGPPTHGSMHASPPAAERSSGVPILLGLVGGVVLLSAVGLVMLFGVSWLSHSQGTNSSAGATPSPVAAPEPDDEDFPSGNIPGLPAGGGSSSYDVTAEAKTAFETARKTHPDLKVALISVNGAKLDGTVDLSTQITNTVSFQFVAADACVLTSVTQMGTTSINLKKSDCARGGGPMPRCSLASVMKRAFAQTKASPGAQGIVSYTPTAGAGTWSVTLGILSHAQIADDC